MGEYILTHITGVIANIFLPFCDMKIPNLQIEINRKSSELKFLNNVIIMIKVQLVGQVRSSRVFNLSTSKRREIILINKSYKLVYEH